VASWKGFHPRTHRAGLRDRVRSSDTWRELRVEGGDPGADREPAGGII